MVRPAVRIVLGSAVVLLVALFWFDPGDADPSAGQRGDGSRLEQLEALMGVDLPDGVVLLHQKRYDGLDTLVRAKLAFTPAQWESFVSTLPVEPDAFEEGQRYLLGASEDGWNPEESATLPTAQIPLPGARVLNLGIDRSSSPRFTVFLVWHET